MSALTTVPDAVLELVRAYGSCISACTDDGWIELTAPVPRSLGGLLPWEALVLNGRTDSPAKLVLPSGGADLRLRAEILADEDIDVTARAQRACEGMVALAAAASAPPDDREQLAGPPTARAGEPSAAAAPGGRDGETGASADLRALVVDAGWPFVLRSTNVLALDLEVPFQFQQAVLEAGGAGCRARTVLLITRAPSAGSRAAISALLLTVAGNVRMVRAGAVSHEDEVTVFFEVNFSGGVSATELRHGLAALAVACRLAGREARVLMDERVAQAYLAARLGAALSQPPV